MAKILSKIFLLLSVTVPISGNVLAQLLSMDRGPSWQTNVAELRSGIASSKIPVYKMETKLVDSLTSADYQEINSSTEKIVTNDVVEMESKNIWWVQGGSLYIRLFNSSPRSVNSVVLSMIDGSCSGRGASQRMFLLLKLTPTQLKEGRYMVYSGALPFVYRDYFKKGVACAIVESAYMKKEPKAQEKSMSINSKKSQLDQPINSKIKQGFEWGDVKIIPKE